MADTENQNDPQSREHAGLRYGPEPPPRTGYVSK